jgi:argininosuccinate synthase
MKKINKIVLAYSGGLDTTVILHWLKETYNAEVVVFTADLGQDHDPELVEKRANTIGAMSFQCLEQIHSMKGSIYWVLL